MEKERRKFKRFDAFMSVKCGVSEGDKKVSLGLSKDLSREGIRVSSGSPIAEGSVLDLEIDIPDDPRPIRTTGKVVWTKTDQDREEGIDHGIKFLTIDPIDKFRVLDYAYNHWLETRVNDFSDPEDISEIS